MRLGRRLGVGFEDGDWNGEKGAEEGERLEDARDRVVDLIVEMERSSCGASTAL